MDNLPSLASSRKCARRRRPPPLGASRFFPAVSLIAGVPRHVVLTASFPRPPPPSKKAPNAATRRPPRLQSWAAPASFDHHHCALLPLLFSRAA